MKNPLRVEIVEKKARYFLKRLKGMIRKRKLHGKRSRQKQNKNPTEEKKNSSELKCLNCNTFLY